MAAALAACLALSQGCGIVPSEEQSSADQEPPAADERASGLLVVSADGSGSARAWAELVPQLVLGDDPAQLYAVKFHVQTTGAPEVVIPDTVLDINQPDLVTWLSDTTVMFADSFVVDVSTGERRCLKDPTPQAKLDPSRRKIAYWAMTASSDHCINILDVATGASETIVSFGVSDWGIADGEFGVPPRLAWLDPDTLLFDMPSKGKPAIGVYRLSSRETMEFRTDAWGIQTSQDGRYMCYSRRSDWGPSPDQTNNQLVVEERATGSTVIVGLEAEWYRARVSWLDNDGMAIVDGTNIGLYKLVGKAWTVVKKESVAGQIIAVRSLANGVEYTDLLRDSGTPSGCATGQLLFDMK